MRDDIPQEKRLSRRDLALLSAVGFYPWGGHHWVADRDSGGFCYPDGWAVEQALEWAIEDGLNPCASCEEYWPALKDDFLCAQHREESA